MIIDVNKTSVYNAVPFLSDLRSPHSKNHGLLGSSSSATPPVKVQIGKMTSLFSWDIQGSCLFHNHLGQPLKKTSMSSTKRPFSHQKSMYLWDINPAWLVLIGCFLWVFMQANIYRFYLQEFFCQKLNVCQKNIRLGDIMTVMTSQYLHHKKNWLVAFYHQSEANMLVKMGSSSPIFRVNMLKIRELPPARKTSTPFLDVSSACLRHNGDLPQRPRGVIRDEDARGIFLVRPKRRFVGPRTLCSFKEKIHVLVNWPTSDINLQGNVSVYIFTYHAWHLGTARLQNGVFALGREGIESSANKRHWQSTLHLMMVLGW